MNRPTIDPYVTECERIGDHARRDELRAFAQDELEVSGTDHLVFPALWSYSIGPQEIPCRAWEGL
jgi:hypothetical protein